MDTNAIALLHQIAAQKPDSNGLILVLIAIAPTLAAVAAYLKAKAAVAGVKEVHVAINSRLDQWLAIERSQGIASGRQTERDSRKRKK